MTLIQNNLGEFMPDEYDPYQDVERRKKIYANCRVKTKPKPEDMSIVKTCENRDCRRQFHTFNAKRRYCCTACKERESANRKRDKRNKAKGGGANG